MLLKLIGRYGYIAVFAFATVEGDGTLLAAAFLAHRGYLRLWAVIAVGIAATVSRTKSTTGSDAGTEHVSRSAACARRSGGSDRVMQRYGAGMIVASRFAFGLKGPKGRHSDVLRGIRHRAAQIFQPGLHRRRALVSGHGFAGAGIAHLFREAFVELRRYEWYVAAALFLAGISLLIGRELARHRSRRTANR